MARVLGMDVGCWRMVCGEVAVRWPEWGGIYMPWVTFLESGMGECELRRGWAWDGTPLQGFGMVGMGTWAVGPG